MRVGQRVRYVGKDHVYHGAEADDVTREGTVGAVRGNAYPNDESAQPDVFYHPDNWREPLVAITPVSNLEAI